MSDKDWFMGRIVDERDVARKAVWKLATILAVFLAIGMLTAAWAQALPLHVLERDGVTVHLMGGPCMDEVSLRIIRSNRRPLYRAIESSWRMMDGSMRSFAGCWRGATAEDAGQPEAVFFLVFSDGEHFVVPQSEFRKGRGQLGL